jgi:hypothetical protein
MTGHLPVVFLYFSCHFCTAGHVRPEDVSHVLCHCRAMGHLLVGLHFPCHFHTVARPSAGSDQSSSAPILGPFLHLAAVLRGQFSVPMPFLLRFSNRHDCGVFCGDLCFLCCLWFPVQ